MIDFHDYAAGPGGAPLQAGALPLRIIADRIEVLLVTTLSSRSWGVPKGWPKVGEDLRDAAMREALEEAGVGGSIAPAPLTVYRHSKPPKYGRPGTRDIALFVLTVWNVEETWLDSHRRKRQWFNLPEAASVVQNHHLADVLSSFAASGSADLI